jgi:hypothetical protein
MQYKVSNAGVEIQPKRGMGCESVTEQMPNSITGVVEGEFLMIYENKPSHKLVINSNGQRFRVSGYDACKEGDTISCTKKDAEISGKKVFWYTMDSVVSNTTTTTKKSGRKSGAPSV